MWRNILIYIFINSVLFSVNKIVYYFILEEWTDTNGKNSFSHSEHDPKFLTRY